MKKNPSKVAQWVGRIVANWSLFVSGYALGVWGWEWAVLIALGPAAFCLMVIGALDMIESKLEASA